MVLRQVDSKLEASAAGIHALMEDIAAAAAKPADPASISEAAQPAHRAEASQVRFVSHHALEQLPHAGMQAFALRTLLLGCLCHVSVQEGTAAREDVPTAGATAAEPLDDPPAADDAEDDDDELEAPSIPSGDESDGDEEVSSAACWCSNGCSAICMLHICEHTQVPTYSPFPRPASWTAFMRVMVLQQDPRQVPSLA